MKKFYLSLLAATMFVACTTDDSGILPWGDKVPIKISMEQTRANDSTFENGDQVGLYVVNYEGTTAGTLLSSGNHVDNMCFTLSNGWTPNEEIYWKDQTTLTDFYAYYPYTSAANTMEHPFSVQTNQNSEANYFASDFLWGKKSKVTPTQSAVSIATKHLFSNALIYIVAGEGVTAEELAAANIEVKVCNVETAAKINLATGAVVANGDKADITPWNTGEYYRAMIVPQQVSATNNLVEVLIDNEKYTYATNMTFESGTRHKITITITRDGDTPSNGDKLSVNFTIEQWTDDEFDYGGNASKEPEQSLDSATDFQVAWSNKTPMGATATISVIDPSKQEMVWGAFIFSESDLTLPDESGMTPKEYANQQLAMYADPTYMGGLYIAFNMMAQFDMAALSEMGNTCGCFINYGDAQKIYLVVVGIDKKGVDMDNYTDSSTLATQPNIFEVECLPQPVIKISTLEHKVTSAAGSLALDVNIENPYGNGTVSIDSYTIPSWLTATYNNGKVNISYTENTSALTRQAEIWVVYTYKCNFVSLSGAAYESEVQVTKTIKIEQSKNTSIVIPNYTIQLTGNQFHKLTVNVDTDDNNTYYVVGYEYKGNVADGSLTEVVANKVASSNRPTYVKGNQTAVELKLNRNSYTDNSTAYVYACPVDATNHTLLAEPTYIEVVIDESKVPTLEWVVTDGMQVGSNNYYELYVEPGSTVTLKYTLTNPVDGGVVTMSTFSNYYNVIVGTKDNLIWDYDAQTVTIQIDDYHADKTNHYATLMLKYSDTNDTSWNWNVRSSSLRIIHNTPTTR